MVQVFIFKEIFPLFKFKDYFMKYLVFIELFLCKKKINVHSKSCRIYFIFNNCATECLWFLAMSLMEIQMIKQYQVKWLSSIIFHHLLLISISK